MGEYLWILYMKKLKESEKLEYKSAFAGRDEEWLGLIKTIVALANTNGGQIVLQGIAIRSSEFDSAKIDDKVNSYITPRIQNISTSIDDKIVLNIPNSLSKPHIFCRDGKYHNSNPPPQQLTEFYKGQVWVRHSSKNEIAINDDYERMFKEKLDKFLSRIKLIAKFPIEREINIEEIPPMKIIKKGRGLPVMVKKEKVDKIKYFIYGTKALAGELGTKEPFIYMTLKKLKLNDNPKYCYENKSASGHLLERRYNQKTVLLLKQYLIENPNFNPYK